MKSVALDLPHAALPESLRELVADLGEAGALRLTGVCGGQQITVPRRASADHPLRAGLGDALFEKLVASYSGINMEVPKCDGFLRELRHEQVRQCREQGLTMDEIAHATGYSRRHVMNILGGHDGRDVYTMDMFDVDEADWHGRHAPQVPTGSQAGKAHDPFGLARRV
jgi:hypothetical protein